MHRHYLLFASRVLSKVFLSRVSSIVPTLGPGTPLNREFSSIFCSFFFNSPTIPFERHGCLCVSSFKDHDDENRNLLNSMCFHGRLSIWRMHVWILKTKNGIAHVWFLYILRGFPPSEVSITMLVPEVFINRLFFFSFLWVRRNRKWDLERDQNWHKKRDFRWSFRHVRFDCRWSLRRLHVTLSVADSSSR